MTPLSVTKAAGDGSFGRLAPLPAPKFRTNRSNGETDGLLRSESATLARLRIDKEECGVILAEEEEAVDVSPGGHITKRLARSRPVSQELMDSAGSQVSYLLFCSAALPPFFFLFFFLLLHFRANVWLVTASHTRHRKAKTQIYHFQRCLPHHTFVCLVHIFLTHDVSQPSTTHHAR